VTVIGRRLALVPVVTFVVVTIVFALLRLLPTDAAKILASSAGGSTEAEAAQLKEDLGLSDSTPSQFVDYLSDLIHLDFGESYYGNVPVSELLGQTLPVTIELTIAAMLIATVLGVAAGILSAARRDGWLDTGIRGSSTLVMSLPWFALGVIFIVVFGVVWDVLPIFGRLPPGTDYDGTTNFVLIDAFLDNRFDLIVPWAEHLLLPALTLGLTTAAFVMRITRVAFLDTMSEPYVQTAKMKGMRERAILVRHALRNAAIPILTILGILFGSLIGGAVVTEKVFSYPGVGSLLVDGIAKRDFYVVQGAALTIALLFILVNTLVDITYTILDPRLRSHH
jgi:peptide/nickel transport system permease protein